MELEKFIESTLVQIAQGVHNAQKPLSLLGGSANPHMKVLRDDQTIGQAPNREGDRISLIEFDVAVSATTNSSKKGGIGVLATVVKIGGEAESAKENGTVSRIKFSVPILLPPYRH